MKVKLVVSIEVPKLGCKFEEDTEFEVVEVKGGFYICQNDEINCLYIPKDFCKVIENKYYRLLYPQVRGYFLLNFYKFLIKCIYIFIIFYDIIILNEDKEEELCYLLRQKKVFTRL